MSISSNLSIIHTSASKHQAGLSADSQMFASQDDATKHHSTFDTYLHKSCIAAAFLIPLKLSLTYVVLIPLLTAWIVRGARANSTWKTALTTVPVLAPLGFFLLAITISSLLGMNPAHSLGPLASTIFFATTILVFMEFGTTNRVLPALVLGQSIASLHSVLEASFPLYVRRLFIGEVTEAGQLAITLPVAIGLAWHYGEKLPDQLSTGRSRLLFPLGSMIGILLIFVGFRNEITLSPIASTLAWILVILLTVAIYVTAKKGPAEWKRYAIMSGIEIPLLVAALLVNLKRGPWLGVIVGCLVFCCLMAPKLVKWIIGSALLIGFGLEPVRERIAASYAHFVISGGRSTIWRIGSELAAQYPLGIGYHNSEILRRFAPEIPPELRHFHNDLLNITTECGWLATGIFIWFLVVTIRYAFTKPRKALHVAIGCGVISWQVAGLGEYNFGDSEVLLIVWMVLGALIYERSRKDSSNPSASLSTQPEKA